MAFVSDNWQKIVTIRSESLTLALMLVYLQFYRLLKCCFQSHFWNQFSFKIQINFYKNQSHPTEIDSGKQDNYWMNRKQARGKNSHPHGSHVWMSPCVSGLVTLLGQGYVACHTSCDHLVINTISLPVVWVMHCTMLRLLKEEMSKHIVL